MNISEQAYITNELQKIKGATHIRIGRAADMIWIALTGTDGKEYAIHLQTFFRFCSEDGVLITDMDKYQPLNEFRDNEEFDWDKQGNNLFDQWCNRFNSTYTDTITVKSVEVNNMGDLTVIFDNGIFLDVLIDNTSEDECWRFFEKEAAEENDLIVLGNSVIS